jgi:hypothetical protein
MRKVPSISGYEQTACRHITPFEYIILIPSLGSCSLYCLISGQEANTNFVVFGLTRPRLEPMIYRKRGEHVNHYSTDVVL